MQGNRGTENRRERRTTFNGAGIEISAQVNNFSEYQNQLSKRGNIKSQVLLAPNHMFFQNPFGRIQERAQCS